MLPDGHGVRERRQRQVYGSFLIVGRFDLRIEAHFGKMVQNFYADPVKCHDSELKLDTLESRAVCHSKTTEEEPEPLIEVISSFSSWHRRSRPSPRHVLPAAASTVSVERAWDAVAVRNGLSRGTPSNGKREDECNGDQNYCLEGDYCCPSDMACCPTTDGYKGCCEAGPDVRFVENLIQFKTSKLI